MPLRVDQGRKRLVHTSIEVESQIALPQTLLNHNTYPYWATLGLPQVHQAAREPKLHPTFKYAPIGLNIDR